MTKCSGVAKPKCVDPCAWTVGKGCSKPPAVKEAEAAAKAAAKAAKEAKKKAVKETALARKAASKASSAIKAVRDAKVKEIKAVKKVKEVKVKMEAKKEKVVKPKADKPVKEKVVKTKAEKPSKFVMVKNNVNELLEKPKPMSIKTALPLNILTVSRVAYDGTIVRKIYKHAAAVIDNMFVKARENYIREICSHTFFYVPSKDSFVVLLRTRSSAEPKNKKNNDYIGVEFTYAQDRKYKISMSKDVITLVENVAGKLDKSSTAPLKALQKEYKDAVVAYLNV